MLESVVVNNLILSQQRCSDFYCFLFNVDQYLRLSCLLVALNLLPARAALLEKALPRQNAINKTSSIITVFPC